MTETLKTNINQKQNIPHCRNDSTIQSKNLRKTKNRYDNP